jgi:thiamine kinase-like enzyme
VVPLKGGVSNASFTVQDRAGKFVARVGEDYPFHHVFREAEVIASQAAFEAGLSPEVVYTAPGIMVVRFIEARTYAEADVRGNAGACVDIVKRCHAEMGKRISGRANIFWVFHVLRDYAHSLKDGESRHLSLLPRLMRIAEELEQAVGRIDVVYGHNDLLPTNIMDDGKRLWLIDWDYAGFNSPLFDLANLCSNNDIPAAGETRLLEDYFEQPLTAELNHRYQAMKCASLLREAMWSMISEIHSTLDFDYRAYTADYLARFEKIYAAFKQL